MDKFADKHSDGTTQDSTERGAESAVNRDRRRFSRAAIAGGAVLLSLGNRSAWGATGEIAGCMSVMTLNSFHPETGMFTSSPAGRPDHNIQLAAEIHRIGSAPDYIGQDGLWRTCPAPNGSDYVCLVRGDCQ